MARTERARARRTAASARFWQRMGAIALGAAAALGCLPLEDLSEYSQSASAAGAGDGRVTEEASLSPGGPASAAGSATSDSSAGVITVGSAALESSDPSSTGSSSDAPDVVLITSPDCSAAGEFSDPSGEVCYRLSDARSSWRDARDTCAGEGSALVAINSEDEDALLGRELSVTIWIGANDLKREGTFAWVNGDPFDFARFEDGGPNNRFGVQDCVERRASDSLWNDRDCWVQNFFVCERLLGP